MRNRLFTAITAVAALIAVMVIPAAAQSIPAGPPGTGYWVFWQVQNIDTAAGAISMTAYEVEGGDGDSVNSLSFNIGQGNALAYHPGLAPTFDNGGDRIGFSSDINFSKGSAVISSDVDVVAIAQLGNNNSGTVGGGGKATSFYQGIGSTNASQTVNFPLVKNDFNGQTTTFYVQSAGSDANVTITYKMNDGSTATETRTIGANRMWEFSPVNAVEGDGSKIDTGCSGGGATSACQGAATAVSSSGSIVGVVVEHPTVGAPAALALSTRGLTDADQGTKLLAPIIKNAFNGSTTGFSVQNVGTAAATVDINLTVTNASDAALIGNTYNETVTIQPGAAEIFIAARNNLGGMPAGTFASATVESNGSQLVGTVNENNKGQKAVYAAFCTEGCGSAGTAATKTKLAAPLVKDFFNGKTTGLVVANAGTAATKMKATYVDASGTTRVIESTQDVPAGGAVSFFSVNTNPGTRFTAVSGVTNFADFFNSKNSVIVESTTGQPIVAVAQESARDSSGLDIKNYEGFNY